MSSPQSLKDVVDQVLNHQKEVYSVEDGSIVRSRIFQSRLMSEKDNYKDIVFPFIRMTSKEKQMRQRSFFLDQTSITCRKVVEHILQMIHTKRFTENDFVILLKCISFKYLRDDVYEFVYQRESNLIEEQIAYQTLNPYEWICHFEKFITLWIQTADVPLNSRTSLIIKIQEDCKVNTGKEKIFKITTLILTAYQLLECCLYDSQQNRLKDNQQSIEVVQMPQENNTKQQKKIKIRSCQMHFNVFQVTEETSLQLNPDQSIVKAVFSKGVILFHKNSEIFYNAGKHIFLINSHLNLPKIYFKLKYKGYLNRQGLPNISGEIYAENIIIFSGNFQNGLLHGVGQFVDADSRMIAKGTFANNTFHGQNNYEIVNNGPQVTYAYGKFEYGRCRQPQIITLEQLSKMSQIQKQNEEEMRMSTNLFNIKDISINNYQFNSLNVGFWVNQSIIDQHVLQVYHDYNLINQVKQQEKYLLITTNMFQDIFSSMITEKVELDYKAFEIFMKSQGFQNQLPKRILFLLNYDRSHFLLFLYEDLVLFNIDSLQGNAYEILTKKLVDLLSKFNFPLKTQSFTKVDVSQQENGYDCGIYTLYYACQLIKNQSLPLIQRLKELKVKQSYINQYRQHIAKCLYGRYAQL